MHRRLKYPIKLTVNYSKKKKKTSNFLSGLRGDLTVSYDLPLFLSMSLLSKKKAFKIMFCDTLCICLDPIDVCA